MAVSNVGVVSDQPGVQVEALTEWLDRAHPGLRSGPLAIELLVGGKSNLTYSVTDTRHHWALRRPPLGHVLPTAHDMGREFKVISALARSGVPVADPVAFCGDPEVLGAPFYLMSFVDGVILDNARTVASTAPEQAHAASSALIDTLVALHQLDPSSVGLGDFGRPEGFLERQLRRWHQQWQASETRPLATLDQVVAGLHRSIPVSGPPAIVHGDYRMTNVIFAPELNQVAAVIDWEMATVGDPLTDVGLLAVYHRQALTSDAVMPRMTPEQGFLGPDELLARYGAATGREVDELTWYVAFGYFKLAVVAEGIAARFAQGQTVGPGFAELVATVPTLLDAAHHELEKGR